MIDDPLLDDDERRPDGDLDDSLRSRIEGLVPEVVKKLALAGVGALFMTEEGIRNVLAEMKLPREAVSAVLSSTEKARSELFRVIAVELRRFLEHANLAGEITKALSDVAIDVSATITFRQVDGGLEPKLEMETTRRPAEGAEAEQGARDPAAAGEGASAP